MINEIGNKSREFYEFVLPPIDVYRDEDNVIVIIDIPGFNKEDIKLTIHKNILSIRAKKNEEKREEIIWRQRPSIIDKKITLPVDIKEEYENINSAKYADGVLIVTIPITEPDKKIKIE